MLTATWPTATQPLRDEHQELLPQIEMLRSLGDRADRAGTAAYREDFDALYAFLTHHLLPHAQAEEAALYPLVGRVLGAPAATATMTRDHREINMLVRELAAQRAVLDHGPVGAAQLNTLRRILYGLYTLLKVHFVKEEEVYLPILDARLTAEEMRPVFTAMEEAAAQARQ